MFDVMFVTRYRCEYSDPVTSSRTGGWAPPAPEPPPMYVTLNVSSAVSPLPAAGYPDRASVLGCSGGSYPPRIAWRWDGAAGASSASAAAAAGRPAAATATAATATAAKSSAGAPRPSVPGDLGAAGRPAPRPAPRISRPVRQRRYTAQASVGGLINAAVRGRDADAKALSAEGSTAPPPSPGRPPRAPPRAPRIRPLAGPHRSLGRQPPLISTAYTRHARRPSPRSFPRRPARAAARARGPPCAGAAHCRQAVELIRSIERIARHPARLDHPARRRGRRGRRGRRRRC